MTGIIVQYLLFGYPPSLSLSTTTSPVPFAFGTGQISESLFEPCSPDNDGIRIVEKPYVRPGLGNAVFSYEETWNRDSLEKMIHGHKGFLARDWPLHLGWNNVCQFSFFALALSVYSDHWELSLFDS